MGLPISVCMIVRDEAEALPVCLASVRDWVTEVVVVDTGSQDDTVRIAQEMGAKVAFFPWQDDFAAARNYSLSLAQGDWILVLDADEVVLPEAVPLLGEVVQDATLLAVQLVRQELGSQQNPYTLVSRLFRNRRDIYFQGAYHELIDDSITQIQAREPHWRVGQLATVALRHWGYTPAAIEKRQKQARMMRILTQAAARQPQDAYLCAKLGALYLAEGQMEQALTWLTQGLALHPPEPMVQYELHFHLGLLYGRQGQWPQAETHYQQAIQTACPPLVKLGAYTNLGSLYHEQGALAQARTLFEQVVHLAPTWATGYYNLGLTLKAQKLLPAAVQAYQKALELDPTLAAAHQNLGIVWCHLGDLRRAQTHWQTAIALYQQQGSAAGEKLQQELQRLGLLPPPPAGHADT
ncbi:tetratricopeptide repeat protein [Gloeomargarita sp.]